jgi:nucleoside-diphosphate-sugar epimerase
MDAYNDSKAKAEALVLAANGQGGLLTVALRPAGIFGYAVNPPAHPYSYPFTVLVIVKSCQGFTKSTNEARLISKLATTQTSLTGHTLEMLLVLIFLQQTS